MRGKMLLFGGLLFSLVAVSTVLGLMYLAGTVQGMAELGFSARALVLTTPTAEGPNSTVLAEIDASVERVLDIYGTSYETLVVDRLSQDALYDVNGRPKYSVIIVDDNGLTPQGARILLDAVANHSIGLVTHTDSLRYLGDAIQLKTIPDGQWEKGKFYGDFAIDDADHYVTSMFYQPIEHQTHNLGDLEPKRASYFQAARPTDGFRGKILARAMVHGHGPGVEHYQESQLFPEIVASELGRGRVVWFARPFSSYEVASFYFVERDRSLALLVPRAAEWASGCVMASKWMYPEGKWSAYVPVLEGYYSAPPPGYDLHSTSPPKYSTGSGTELIDQYRKTEDVLLRQGVPATLGLVLCRAEDSYELGRVDPCLNRIDELLRSGFDIGLSANHYAEYDRQPSEEVAKDLKEGREELLKLFPSLDPQYLSYLPSFQPRMDIIPTRVQQAAKEVGFRIAAGGIFKSNFPYDFYGSIYPLLQTDRKSREGEKNGFLVLDYNQYFDEITEETDTYYYEDIHRLAGCAVVVIRPWAISGRPDLRRRLEDQILEAKGYGDVWFTTVGGLARYWFDRQDVKFDTGVTPRAITLHISGLAERVRGFTVKLSMGTRPDTGPQYALDEIEVSGIPSDEVHQALRGKSLFLWFDLPAEADVKVIIPTAS